MKIYKIYVIAQFSLSNGIRGEPEFKGPIKELELKGLVGEPKKAEESWESLNI